jgi:hypothetical protein
MDDLRSSKEQLKDELDLMFKQMTDPEELEKARDKKIRDKNLTELEQDYGI